MPDTKMRLTGMPIGWTVYTRLKDEAGQIWDSVSSAMAAYVVANIARFRLATPETPAGSGDYEATMPAGLPAGNYTWAHYRLMGADAALTDPSLGGGGSFWDGTTFGTAGGASAGDADLRSDVVVDDPAPTPLGFVVAMADGSDVPDTFVWRSGLACFTAASALRTGKFPIATYVKLTDTTARLTFLPALPATPADAEALQII